MADEIIYEDDWTEKQRELYDLMSEISEDCYCAHWMSGLEYAVWGALRSGDRKYGQSFMDAPTLERCRQLSQELDGWIFWDADRPVWIAMPQWLKKFEELWGSMHLSSQTNKT